jgi:hypothetical protein
MQARKFEHFLKQLTALTRRQRQHLLGGTAWPDNGQLSSSCHFSIAICTFSRK